MLNHKESLIEKFKTFCLNPDNRKYIDDSIKIQLVKYKGKKFYIEFDLRRIELLCDLESDFGFYIYECWKHPSRLGNTQWVLQKAEYNELVEVFLTAFDFDAWLKEVKNLVADITKSAFKSIEGVSIKNNNHEAK